MSGTGGLLLLQIKPDLCPNCASLEGLSYSICCIARNLKKNKDKYNTQIQIHDIINRNTKMERKGGWKALVLCVTKFAILKGSVGQGNKNTLFKGVNNCVIRECFKWNLECYSRADLPV